MIRTRDKALVAVAAAVLWNTACGDSSGARSTASDPARVPEDSNRLASLPYLNITTRSAQQQANPGASGVLAMDEAAVSRGFGLYNNHYRNRAVLIDLRGRVVHEWKSDAGQDKIRRRFRWGLPPYLGWHHVEMDRRGHLYVIVGYPPMPLGGVLVELDWSSKPKWELPIGAHHDIAIGADGAVYTLTFGLEPMEHEGKRYVIEQERIVRIVDGKVVASVSLNELLSAHETLGPLLAAKKASLARKCADAIADRDRARKSVYRKLLYHQLDLYSTGRVLTHDGLVEPSFPRDVARRLDELARLFLEATTSAKSRARFRRRFSELEGRFVARSPRDVARAVRRSIGRLYAHIDPKKGLTSTSPEALLILSHYCRANAIHSNTIEVIPRDLPGVWKKGDLLTSFRQLDVVAVVRMDREGKARIVWHTGPGTISRQHQPALTADDHILVFDNGVSSRRSRVVKIDPRTEEVVWSYGDKKGDKSFYSWWKGGSEELPNGNVLIANTVTGEVFEVTPKRKIVWYFVAPADSLGKVAQVYRFTRLPEPLVRELDPSIGPSLPDLSAEEP